MSVSGSGPIGRSVEGRSRVTGGPAREQGQRILRRRTGLGEVGHQTGGRARLERQRLEGEGEIADDRVVQLLDAVVVDADVVGGPADAEVLRRSGQLADQAGELSV